MERMRKWNIVSRRGPIRAGGNTGKTGPHAVNRFDKKSVPGRWHGTPSAPLENSGAEAESALPVSAECDQPSRI
jgi:hypothetical protein